MPHATGHGYDYLYCAVDVHSRLAYLEAHRRLKATTCSDFLRRAQVFYADHGLSVLP